LLVTVILALFGDDIYRGSDQDPWHSMEGTLLIGDHFAGNNSFWGAAVLGMRLLHTGRSSWRHHRVSSIRCRSITLCERVIDCRVTVSRLRSTRLREWQAATEPYVVHDPGAAMIR